MGEMQGRKEHGTADVRKRGINVYMTGRFARVRHMQGRREEETGGVYADIRRGLPTTENAARLFSKVRSASEGQMTCYCGPH
jgi:hypothetical protein